MTNEDPTIGLCCVYHVYIFLGAHKCRRTCCDWHEAYGLSSHSIYVISVLQTGGAMRSLEWSTLFGLTACSQAADSFWAQDVWVTRHNSGQRENRPFKNFCLMSKWFTGLMLLQETVIVLICLVLKHNQLLLIDPRELSRFHIQTQYKAALIYKPYL